MLEVQGLNAWYGAAQALFDVSLQLGRGELVVLQGLNGAGKSTLLMSIIGLAPQVRGQLRWQGQDIAALPPFERVRLGLGWVPEDRRLFAELTVLENLTVAATLQKGMGGQSGEEVPALERVLAMFPHLKQMLHRPAAQMSGGEQQMLSMARTLMGAPALLLLDEPCEGIAPVLVESIAEAILGLKAQGMALLVAEQNTLLAQHADRVITLAGGQIAGANP